jgi:hypothetical protein
VLLTSSCCFFILYPLHLFIYFFPPLVSKPFHARFLPPVILLGESWTGKSNIFSRIIRNSFSHNSYGTIGLNYARQSFPLSTDLNAMGEKLSLLFSSSDLISDIC